MSGAPPHPPADPRPGGSPCCRPAARPRAGPARARPRGRLARPNDGVPCPPQGPAPGWLLPHHLLAVLAAVRLSATPQTEPWLTPMLLLWLALLRIGCIALQRSEGFSHWPPHHCWPTTSPNHRNNRHACRSSNKTSHGTRGQHQSTIGYRVPGAPLTSRSLAWGLRLRSLEAIIAARLRLSAVGWSLANFLIQICLQGLG